MRPSFTARIRNTIAPRQSRPHFVSKSLANSLQKCALRALFPTRGGGGVFSFRRYQLALGLGARDVMVSDGLEQLAL